MDKKYLYGEVLRYGRTMVLAQINLLKINSEFGKFSVLNINYMSKRTVHAARVLSLEITSKYLD